MGKAKRQELIKKLSDTRGGRLVIAYVTSTRTGFEMQMADDMLRYLYEHLKAGSDAAKKGVDLLIHSNGGSGTVPWRLVSLIREYAESFAVLVPHRAFSAATLVALGADEIVMHKMGCLGPIDPSVTNVFNPTHPLNVSQFAPISVEDVSAYFKLVKDEVGIQHEDELVQALGALTDKVHPLALGNVQRSHNQSRMMARKLLNKHVAKDKEHEISQIIENLKSNLFFHGHPINRDEALKDLKLKVATPEPKVEEAMWNLYVEYEGDLKILEPFNALHELDKSGASVPSAAGTPPTVAQLVQQMQQLAQAGIALGQVSPQQFVELAAALLPIVSGQGGPATKPKVRHQGVTGAYLESTGRTDVFLTDLTIERTVLNTPSGPQEASKTEVLWQRWEQEK